MHSASVDGGKYHTQNRRNRSPIRKKKKRHRMHWQFHTWWPISKLGLPRCVHQSVFFLFFFSWLRQTSQLSILKTTFRLGFFSSLQYEEFRSSFGLQSLQKSVQKQGIQWECTRKQVLNEFFAHIKTKKSQRSSQIHSSSHPDWLLRFPSDKTILSSPL